MGLNLCAIDSTWERSMLMARLVEFATPGGPTVIIVSTVADMVRQVTDMAISDKIDSLMIVGHGAPAYQGVGAGRSYDLTGDKSLQVDSLQTSLTLLGTAANLLPRLRGQFSLNGFVRLCGCRVAGTGSDSEFLPGVDGRILLRAVSASLAGIPVEAYDFYQSAALVPTGLVGDLIRCQDNTCWTARPWYYPG